MVRFKCSELIYILLFIKNVKKNKKLVNLYLSLTKLERYLRTILKILKCVRDKIKKKKNK